jgi:PAS domain S-box-containing protein
MTEPRPGQDPLAEETYRALFESAPDAVLVVDSDGCVVALNPQAERMFGYAADELRGQPIERLLPAQFADAHKAHRTNYAANPIPRPMGSGLELWGRHKAGSEFPVEISLSPLQDGQRRLLSASVRDVTDRRRAQEELRKARDELEKRVAERTAELAAQVLETERGSEQLRRQAEMLDVASEPIFAWDMERGIVFWNKAATETYGYTREEALGRVSHELLATETPGGIRPLRERLRRGGRWSGELLHTTRNGRKIVAESRMVMLSTLSGQRLVLESCRDITARRAAEETLRQSQKMEAVGQLTGGIAHDFNNLLTIILANLQLLEDELASGSLPRELADNATRAALRGAELTRKLLVFARRQQLEAAPLDVNERVANMTGILARTLGERIQVREMLAPGLAPALVDAGQLETALLNLAVNARDAMPHGGALSIETFETIVDDDNAAQLDLARGVYVSICVADTGTGMTDEVKRRAFEPFFTTKDTGRGTGLGLSMVYGFATQSGGSVTLESELGNGTRVTLHLPRAKADSIAAAPTRYRDLRGSESILLVEDDDQVRAATARLLKGLGYRVNEAPDAATALALLATDDSVDLLFTDVVLANGRSGPELVREARRIRPALKVLFMSGHVRDAAAFREELERDARFIGKPFKKQDLAEMLRATLDDASHGAS